jgi:hypothetical protein
MDRLIHDDDRVYDYIAGKSGLVHVRDFIGIAREVDGQLVAAVGYDHHQDWSCSFHIAAEPRGIDRLLLRMMFEVPFKQWDYRLLLGIIQAGNAKSLNIASRLGFSTVLSLADAHPSGSLEFWTLRREDCKWLALNEKNNHVRRRLSSQGSRP